MRGRLPALQHPDYRRYLAGSFVSNVGNMVQATAVALHVYQLTGSSFMVGLLGLVRVGPLLVFSLIGGILADHHDRRNVILATQSSMGLIALCFTLMEWSGLTHVGLIYLFIALYATARAFDGPARQAMVPNLVPVKDLPNAIGINGISWRLSDVLGPVVAGGVLLWGGLPGLGQYGTCYLLNFVSFGAVMVALVGIGPRPPQGQDSSRPQNVAELWKAISDGLAFVHRTPVLRSAMWIDFWATFFSAADALLPAFATKVLGKGEAAYSLLQASIGIGALLGALVMTWLPTIRQQGRWVVIMVGLYGLFTVLFGLSTSLVMAVIFLAGTGFADMVSTVLRQTIRQMATPDSMRGRMSATSTLFNVSGPQLGDFEAGAVAAAAGERASVAIGGLVSILIALNWRRGGGLKDYEHADDAPATRVPQPASGVGNTGGPGA